MLIVFVAHLLAAVFMTGLVWFVQIVHYPLMAWVGPDQFIAYSQRHQRRTSMIVLPVMLVELGTGLTIAYYSIHTKVMLWAAWAGVALLALVWGMTMLVHVPQHGQLLKGFDPALVRQLVLANWVRTVAWTIRSGLAFWLLLNFVA